ncbi:Crp/Fnr family transcriptional regulator [Tenacibaculum haliotis]|uniref:Crp/Fnr family transcriptional regulator n=1 Tax=Tenacibaculum haliotis TaxID=1888914 RepID=UPI0021B0783E|nr:Crp/Fnr family transcriptional regulator [Tenacibaculum haliotis]MCT4699011.1 Crp/Fnr family transcriptional regulator [Tenacibaculum haliotis]
MTNQLKTYLLDYFNFDSNDDELLEKYFVIKKYKKKDFLIQENTKSSDFFLILEGYVRTFHISEQGEEITTEILENGELVCSMYSLLKNEKTFENSQCIGDCLVCIISEKTFEKLCTENPQWFQLGMKFLKNDILKKEERIRGFSKLKANERYQKLISEKPNIIQNVPIIYIASYLGIKPESLSRLRSQTIIS